MLLLYILKLRLCKNGSATVEAKYSILVDLQRFFCIKEPGLCQCVLAHLRPGAFCCKIEMMSRMYATGALAPRWRVM